MLPDEECKRLIFPSLKQTKDSPPAIYSCTHLFHKACTCAHTEPEARAPRPMHTLAHTKPAENSLTLL